MITAKEARDKIDELATKRGQEERRIAEELISYAVECGESSCCLGRSISDATKAWLESLGYQVRIIDSPINQTDTEVKW